MIFVLICLHFFSGRVSIRNEESYFMTNHTTSTSLGSRINCTNSNVSPSPVRKSFFQSVSPITTTTILPDGRVERRLETCSYQETEMVSTGNSVPNCVSVLIITSFHYSDFDGLRSVLSSKKTKRKQHLLFPIIATIFKLLCFIQINFSLEKFLKHLKKKETGKVEFLNDNNGMHFVIILP